MALHEELICPSRGGELISFEIVEYHVEEAILLHFEVRAYRPIQQSHRPTASMSFRHGGNDVHVSPVVAGAESVDDLFVLAVYQEGAESVSDVDNVYGVVGTCLVDHFQGETAHRFGV